MKRILITDGIERSGAVDETALLDALNRRKVLYAGLDVFLHEPPTQDEFDLINHPRVSVSPHIGASTREAQDRVGTEVAQKVVDALRARPD
jgi:D-3-phosphoglycerate dehydrogenase